LSKLAIPIILIVILVVAGAYIFLTRGSPGTTSQNSTANSSTSVPLQSAVDQLVQDINARNVDGLVTFYPASSVVVWSGKADGLVGKFPGAGNIKLLYATSVGKATTMSANVSNYAEDKFSPTHINATFMIKMLANSTTAGKVNATINVSEEWNWGNSGWQISRENWAYKYFDASNLDVNQGSATTFPQWGVMEMGGDPNLVSEKSFGVACRTLPGSGGVCFPFLHRVRPDG
jgi:hypothetical protein